MLIEHSDITKTQRQILDAAIKCVKQWGIERVTLNDIAYEARVARSTVYSHYQNRDDVIRSALLLSAYSFGEKLFEHICRFSGSQQRVLETVVFSLSALPDEPSLALVSDTSLSQMVREHTLTTPEGMDISTALIRVILEGEDCCQEALEEIAEFATRFVLSMLTMASPHPRDEDELRGFVARRLLPALGLEVPSQHRRFGQPQ